MPLTRSPVPKSASFTLLEHADPGPAGILQDREPADVLDLGSGREKDIKILRYHVMALDFASRLIP